MRFNACTTLSATIVLFFFLKPAFELPPRSIFLSTAGVVGETIAQEAKQGGTRNTASVQGIQVGVVVRQFQPARFCRETVFVQSCATP